MRWVRFLIIFCFFNNFANAMALDFEVSQAEGELCQNFVQTLERLGLRHVPFREAESLDLFEEPVLPNFLIDVKRKFDGLQGYQFKQSLDEILQGLAEANQELELDSELFVQIVARLAREKKKFFSLYRKVDSPFVMTQICARDAAFIIPHDGVRYTSLPKAFWSHWVIKDGEDLWTGMRSDGSVKTLSSVEWCEQARRDFEEEWTSFIELNPIKESRPAWWRIMNRQKKAGGFQRWDLSRKSLPKK